MLIYTHKTQVHTEGGGSSRPITVLAVRVVLLDFWRGARQVRRRPVRLCVGYGVGSTQKYKLGFKIRTSVLSFIILHGIIHH